MAGIPRAPGDISVKTRSEARRYRYLSGYTNPGVETIPGYGPWKTVYPNVYRSRRPTYAKGELITLPDGSKFRKSTAYSNESWELSQSDTYECMYREHLRFIWNYSAAQDEGREIGQLIDSAIDIRGVNVPQDARNEAVTKALNKIADQKVNLGENLATLGQTVRMFASKASILYDALKYAKTREPWLPYLMKSARDLRRNGVLNTAAKEYLAYVYGLKPLMQDVYNLSQLAKGQAQKTLLFKGVGRATRMQVAKPGRVGAQSASLCDLLQGEGIYKVKCTVWARIDPDTASLRSLNQLGLLNPLGLAWDLVPYSFCVDWFLPVGPVLYAMTAPAGLIFVDGSISIRSSERMLYNWKVATSSIYYDDGNTSKVSPKFERPMHITREYEGYARSTLSTWPIPGLWFDQDPFRADRPLKALALGIMALSGSRPPVR